MRKKIDAGKAIRTIAMREGVAVEEVRKQIKLAMLAGLCSQDPVIQARWKKVPCKGDAPMPEELIIYIATHLDAEIDLLS
ncbi:MAG: hypothetical protein VB092_03550 [Oscillospiraceae bacterium]|nr:hypothetical protein [Oscillospiraceae bacterium]